MTSQKLRMYIFSDAEHLCQISWKSAVYYSRIHNDLNEPTYDQETRAITICIYLPAEVMNE